MALIDSAAIIHLLEGTDKGIAIQKKYGDDITTTTTINVHEVIADLWPPKREAALRFLSDLEILPFDSDALKKSIEIEERLKRKGKMINRMDVFIAGICMAANMPIITTDDGYKNIDGLKVLMP